MLALVSGADLDPKAGNSLIHEIVDAILACTRETDILGWYKSGQTLGLLMTEIGCADSATVSTLIRKVSDAVGRAASPDRICRLKLTFRVFPQDAAELPTDEFDVFLYPDISGGGCVDRRARTLKRAMDIAGSLMGIMAFLPVFMIVALLVKLTSRGPVFFSQKRVGQYGKEFNFYKFRTMLTGNDPQVHREYIAKLIAGGTDSSYEKGVYKITKDPRVTPVGRFLRRTSLDELPQFFNVLRNDMSLVGPRPPLPYEYERYRVWHRRRVLELKPGLTGLWQVKGRSRTTFDEMVRMDIQYANIRSLWMDIKILLQTPAAMFSGRGAC
ncbi:hypothetical protein GCM10011507_09420 [Edaphobacter acidisoli]|uniref:Bacterial sugar transferase domain-containing protein n=1 Tax=Edaphobacter acidisoli TaxID=2040573 RepID=A0A916RKN0_9BACT|nr:sugar transferase [Edaphobacter acidisoli]GGA59975.1 hypothetical protein GCM10011507_09420 [Edaphobacter acidisoli]